MARRRRPPRPGAMTEFPPLKILTQILILQAIWYSVATVLILFTALVAGRHFTFDMVLSWRSLRGDTTVGWMLGLVWLLNSFIGYVALSTSLQFVFWGPSCFGVPLPQLRTGLGMIVNTKLIRGDGQSYSNPLLHLALEAGPRLRFIVAFHPPSGCIPLLAFPSAELAMVGLSTRVRGDDD